MRWKATLEVAAAENKGLTSVYITTQVFTREIKQGPVICPGGVEEKRHSSAGAMFLHSKQVSFAKMRQRCGRASIADRHVTRWSKSKALCLPANTGR